MTKKKIRKLEEDVKRWQAISERFLEVIPRVFEEGTLAMLRGKQVRYLMRSKEVSYVMCDVICDNVSGFTVMRPYLYP